jgi:hypothetical protein
MYAVFLKVFKAEKLQFILALMHKYMRVYPKLQMVTPLCH